MGSFQNIAGYQAEVIVLRHLRKYQPCYRIARSGRYKRPPGPDIVCLGEQCLVIEVKSTNNWAIRVERRKLELLFRLGGESCIPLLALLYRREGKLCLVYVDEELLGKFSSKYIVFDVRRAASLGNCFVF